MALDWTVVGYIIWIELRAGLDKSLAQVPGASTFRIWYISLLFIVA